MHLGSLRTSGIFGKKNLKHIVLNNYCHESVGGQRTFSESFSFCKLAKEFGYKKTLKIYRNSDLKSGLYNFLESRGPSFLEIIIKEGTLNNLKRPKNFREIKKRFIE